MYRLVNTFLDALLYANNTRTPSSVYSSGKDKGNVKALREWKREQGFSMENSNYQKLQPYEKWLVLMVLSAFYIFCSRTKWKKQHLQPQKIML